MMIVISRRFAATTCFLNPLRLSLFGGYCSKAAIDEMERSSDRSSSANNGYVGFRSHPGGIYRVPLFWQEKHQLDSCAIEVVDSDTWSIASGLAHVSKGADMGSQLGLFGVEEEDDGFAHNHKQNEYDPDVDEVEDMRIRGGLFYKIERSSIEFEEYNFDFHGRKSKSIKNERESKKKDKPKCNLASNGPKSQKSKEEQQPVTKKENSNDGSLVNTERLAGTVRDKYVVSTPDEGSCIGKNRRSPTFNQLTRPYHEPFCLDIHVSRGSVRACVVHRVTSKVIVVAHSISKDIKFDLGSTKSRAAAATVGKVLAERALGDDIHDVIYTPRKGDKLEGKLKIVLQTILDNGVNVKVRLKQRNPSRAIGRSATFRQGTR